MAIVVLAVLLVAGRAVVHDFADYHANAGAIDAEQALEAALRTMEKLELERGPTSGLLTHDATKARQALHAARGATTEAVADLRRRIAHLVDRDDTPSAARVTALAGAVDAIDEARIANNRTIDQGLALAPAERIPDFARSYATREFALMERFVPLLNSLQARVASGSPQAASIVQIARYAADLRELAGWQASTMTAAIAEGRPFTLGELQAAERTQGEINRLQIQIDAAIEYIGSPSSLVDAWGMAQSGYFSRGRAMVDRALASGLSDGHYQMTLAEFIRVLIGELPSLIALRDAATAAATGEAMLSRDIIWTHVASSGLVLLIVFVTVTGLAIGFRRRVVLPLLRLTSKVEQLAGGNHDIEIGLRGRHDEVGGLARAMQVFRDVLVETERLRVEQSRAQQIERRRHIELQESYRQLEAQREELASMTAALEAARDVAEKASRSKSAFVASMSHEIRTPLHGIIGVADLLLRSELHGRPRDLAEMLRGSGQSLLSIVNDILDMSKLEAGGVTIETIDYVPADEITQVIDLLSPKAAEKGLELLTTVDETARRTWSGDPTRLRQVLLNFVGNAIKFTDRGTVTLTARCHEDEANGAWLRIEVVDTGIGISTAAQQLLFKKFTQADQSITRRFGGTGLGLAIAKELVEAMRGEVGVESQPGMGSRFWFALPLRPAEFRQSAIPADATPTRLVGPAARPGKRILLAEDVRVNQVIATDLLTSAGHTVDLARDGQEAIEAAQTGNYDLILMDIHMPRIDGLEATRKIRSLDGPSSRLPIIALTADAIAGRREDYVAAGMSDFLSKPFDPAALAAVVERWTAHPEPDATPHARAPRSDPEDPTIEDLQLASIREALPAAKFNAFVEGVIVATRVRVDRIGVLAADGRLTDLAREAHDLISTAGSAGMVRVVPLARELEKACAAERVEDARLIAEKIKSEAIPVCLALAHRFLAA
jgi:signal transduction histidine kinase/CheY-like chemotaxis protein